MLSLFTIIRRNPRLAGLQPGEVALTFDDGPHMVDEVTPELLDVLHQHRVKASFCVIGQQVRLFPEIIRRIHYSGHLLVNHTENHHHPLRQRFAALVRDIQLCDESIASALGVSSWRSTYFRVPYGIVTFAVRRAVRRLGLKPVLVSHYGWDTEYGPHNFKRVVDRVIANARKHRGGMYVLHDGCFGDELRGEENWPCSPDNRSWVPEAVDRIIRELSADGLRFVTPQNSHRNLETDESRAAA